MYGLRKNSAQFPIRDVLRWSDRCLEHFLPWHAASAGAARTDYIAEAGTSELYPGYELGRTQPRFHLLAYPTYGEGRLFTPHHTAPLETGYVLIAPAGKPFGYKPIRGRWRLIWIHLPDDERWAAVRDAPVTIRRTELTNPIDNAMTGFLSECRSRDFDADAAICLYADLIALYAEREVGRPDSAASPEVAARLDAVWQAVARDLPRPWTVAELAGIAHVSPPHFYRMCRQHTGCSPMKLVARLRMERAQELLVLNDYPVAQVAEMVGYSNEFAFAVAFKRFSGNTPAEFRRRR